MFYLKWLDVSDKYRTDFLGFKIDNTSPTAMEIVHMRLFLSDKTMLYSI